jgi:hypothetical protein
MLSKYGFGALALVALFATALLVGCGDNKATNKTNGNDQKVAQPAGGHSHDGWWCAEHGVPEHMCSLCNDEYAAKCKKEGDWCKEHDRAESQCFKCDPSRYKHFEDMYVAKYGHKPEQPPKSEFEK